MIKSQVSERTPAARARKLCMADSSQAAPFHCAPPASGQLPFPKQLPRSLGHPHSRQTRPERALSALSHASPQEPSAQGHLQLRRRSNLVTCLTFYHVAGRMHMHMHISTAIHSPGQYLWVACHAQVWGHLPTSEHTICKGRYGHFRLLLCVLAPNVALPKRLLCGHNSVPDESQDFQKKPNIILQTACSMA